MKVLVTGSTGFTGSHLVKYLAGAGDAVRALVRDPARALGRFPADVTVVVGDLTDRDSLRLAIDGVEVVYNIGALFRESGLPTAAYHAVNAEAVATIVELAHEAGVRRVVHCSTVGVHGDVENPPADEDAPLRPGDVYQESKVEGERLGREAAERLGQDLVIARPTGIYGPGDRRLFKIFGKVATRRFLLLGSGRNYYHLTYIEDLCRGFRLCATVPEAAGRTYILAGTDVTTLRELVDLTAEIAGVTPPAAWLPVWPFWGAGALCEVVCAPFGIAPPIYRRRVDFFRKSRAFDATRAHRELGFRAEVTPREGIGRTLEWYREQGWI